MEPFFHLAEERIRRAEERGMLRNLAGSGRRLELEDLSRVPDELRASYMLLKSNGFLPPELEARKEWLRLGDLLAACADSEERAQLRSEVARARERYRILLEQRTPRLRGYPARL